MLFFYFGDWGWALHVSDGLLGALEHDVQS